MGKARHVQSGMADCRELPAGNLVRQWVEDDTLGLDRHSRHPPAREVAGPHSGPYGLAPVGSAVRTTDLAVG